MAQAEVDNFQYPFTTVVAIVVTFPDGELFAGSGVLIGRTTS